MKNFGENLKKIRKKLELSLRDVETETGISNAYLSQLENNKIKNPSPKILYKLAKFYKVSYNYLMDLIGYPISEIEENRSFSRRYFGNSSKFNDLTEEEEEKLTEYLQFLRSRRKK
ncbi:MAG: helix-turn-helix domain-containing protein [Candidatus Helarchaeota archaeon]